MSKLLIFIALFLSMTVNAQIIYKKSLEGDFYAYIPEKKPKNILVIAHGMLSKKDKASDVAEKYISRWVRYADDYGLLHQYSTHLVFAILAVVLAAIEIYLGNTLLLIHL